MTMNVKVDSNVALTIVLHTLDSLLLNVMQLIHLYMKDIVPGQLLKDYVVKHLFTTIIAQNHVENVMMQLLTAATSQTKKIH